MSEIAVDAEYFHSEGEDALTPAGEDAGATGQREAAAPTPLLHATLRSEPP